MAWDEGLGGSALEIARCTSSPLRVIAGPGTGKTFCLMRRVCRLLEESVPPERVLVVTFTRVAARDLASSLRRLNVTQAKKVRAGTLHAFCLGTLCRSPVLEATGRTPRLLLKFEERFMLEDLGLKVDGDYHARRRMLNALEAAWARQQKDLPGSPDAENDKLFQHALDEWLRYHRSMLLAELVPLTLQYIRDNPLCPERLKYDHILVDEYQDLNRAEQCLIDALAGASTLTVVGDEDQSIYERLCYAHPEGISEFDCAHPGTHTIPLAECRRCPEKVVALACALIAQNQRRTRHALAPRLGNGAGTVRVVQWPTMEAEIEGIADYVSRKVATGEFDAGQVLVLCPRRQYGYALRDLLRAKGVSSHSFFHEEILDGKPKELDDSEAQQAFTLLTLLANPDDRVALRCWLGFGHMHLRRNEYQRLCDHCLATGTQPREALDAMLRGDLHLAHTRALLDRYRLLLDRLERLGSLDGLARLEDLFPKGRDWTEPILAALIEVESNADPEAILRVLRTAVTQPELPTDADYVRIMSFHKSKGLSADHVIVMGCVEGLIPSRIRACSHQEHQAHLEEQRRLFYVAVTRPRETLVLSSSITLPGDVAHDMGVHVSGGNPSLTPVVASRFLAELGPQCPAASIGQTWHP